VSLRLSKARDDLTVLDQQVAALAEDADEARVRALVSDSPLAEREYRDAQRHADAMARSRAVTAASIAAHERDLDGLLGKLVVKSN